MIDLPQKFLDEIQMCIRDSFDCVQCGNCVRLCPKKCLSIVAGYTKPQTHIETQTVKVSPPGPAGKKAPEASQAPLA